MESGSDGARGTAEDISDLGGLEAEVVAKHEHRPFFGLQPPEGTVELVSICHAEERIRLGRRLDGEDPQIRRPATLASRLLDADTGKEALNPGIEPVRVAKVGQVAPGHDEGVLQCILGPIHVAQDPLREREESVTARPHQVDECRLVASLGRLHEIAVHTHHRLSTSIGGVFRVYRVMVRPMRWKDDADRCSGFEREDLTLAVDGFEMVHAERAEAMGRAGG
jgi:hypothetical protein